MLFTVSISHSQAQGTNENLKKNLSCVLREYPINDMGNGR